MSRRGLLNKLRQEVEKRGGGDGTEGYYRWMQDRDAFLYRRSRKDALRRQAAGEDLQGDHWLLTDRYAENPALASLPDDATFPDLGSKGYPATRAQVRAKLEHEAHWRAGQPERDRRMQAIRARFEEQVSQGRATASSAVQSKPEPSEVNSGAPGEPVAVSEPVREVQPKPSRTAPRDSSAEPSEQEPTWYRPGQDDRYDDPHHFEPDA